MASPAKQNAIIKWIDSRLPIFTFAKHSLQDYPTPKNLSYWWNFGSIAGIILVVMIATGIFLAMHYTPHTAFAFDSVERIMRDVNYGWLMRYVHMNGGSMFFIVVYIHLFRGMYYGSFKSPREILWWLGVVILILMMATAFMGYLLPWGQMSFWGATVITNLFSAIPWIGEDIVIWLRGGFAVGNATLNRFFSLHYLFPFIIVGAVMMHLVALHTSKSGNPIGIEVKGPQDTIPFHPYYTVKDYFGIVVFFIFYAGVVFFAPDFFGEPDNYIPANPLLTPLEIVPEWYFLPFYAILRAFTGDLWFVSAKQLGVIFMFGSLMILFVLPWLDTSPVRSSRFRPIYKWFFWIFVLDCVILGIVGGNSPAAPVFSWSESFTYLLLGQITTFWYFFHFLFILPVLGKIERPSPLPKSISEPVLSGGGVGGAAVAAKPMEKA